MKWGAALVLVGCGAGGAPSGVTLVDGGGGVAVDGFDIVVSSTDIAVWGGFTGTLANNARFAAPGACGGVTDAATIASRGLPPRPRLRFE